MEREDILLPGGELRPECRAALKAISGPLGKMWVGLYDYKLKNGYEVTDEEMDFALKALSTSASAPPPRDLKAMMAPFLAQIAQFGWILDEEKTQWRYQTDLLMSRTTIVLKHHRHTGAAIFIREMKQVAHNDPSLGIGIIVRTTHKGSWTSEKPDGSATPFRQNLIDAAQWLCGEEK